MDPVLLQAAIVVPLILGLSARILLRGGNRAIHWLLSGLLASMAGWVVANVWSELTLGTALGAGGTPALLVGCPLSALYLLTMGFHARVGAIERSPALCVALCVPFVALAALLLTDPWHHLVFQATPGPALTLSEWAGPGFYAYQLWSYGYFLTGLAFAARGLRSAAPPDDRRRAAMIVAASAAPLLAHTASLLEWLPIAYPLTPAAMGVSAVLVVVAIDRYALLDAQPLVQRDVIEELHDGVVLADADGLVVDLNRAAQEILGQRREALRGRSLAEVVRPLLQPAERVLLLGRIVGTGAGFEHEIVTPEGRRLELRARALRGSGLKAGGRFLVIRDRTDKWRHERLLQQRQRLESVGVLAAGVAHEVNNPLAFVRANLAHLDHVASLAPKVVPAGEAGAREFLEMGDVVAESREGLDRIARIVEGLLHFARPPVDRRVPVSLNHVAEAALRFAALHRGSPLQVETAFATDLPPVSASEDRLVQVVLNLLLNARQALAGRRDGRIRVETVVAGSSATLRVRDNGPGVPEEIRERIFDPFFTTRGPGEGTGLGLAIAFDILREHDGTLELEADSEGGACFALRLPLASA